MQRQVSFEPKFVRSPCSAGMCCCALFALCSQGGAIFSRGRLASLLTLNCRRCFHNESRKVRSNAIRYAKHHLHRGITKPTFDQTEHGFRNPGTLTDSIIRKFSPLPLLSQEPDNLFANRFIMFDARHAEVSQESGLDTYFSIVKYRHHAQRSASRVQCEPWSMVSTARTERGSLRAASISAPSRYDEVQTEHSAQIDHSPPRRRSVFKVKSLAFHHIKSSQFRAGQKTRIGAISVRFRR
jgi:hypothetical protein